MKQSYISFLVIVFIANMSILSRAQNIHQIIRGSVTDLDSEIPLIGANVILETEDTIIAAVSGANGFFSLQNVPIGRNTLKITYIGYKDLILSNIMVGSGKEVYLNIKLEESPVQIDEIVIKPSVSKISPINNMASISSRSFTVEETSRYPASVDDPLRMAKNFAGVVMTGEDQSNEIIVRGNSPRGLLWRIEGVPIFNPNHFSEEGTSGGGVCMISNNVLSNSDFYTGAWPAEFSDAISGVFDLNFRNGNHYKREYALQIGMLGVDFAAEGPFSKKSTASYLINYRYSTLAIFDALNLIIKEGDAVPDYQDISYKFYVPTKSLGVFTIWGLGGKSNQTHTLKINTYLNNQGEEVNYIENEGDTWDVYSGVTGITNKIVLNNKSSIKTTFALVGRKEFQKKTYRLDPELNISRFGVGFEESYKLYNYYLSSVYNLKINSKHSWRIGLNYKNNFFNAAKWEYNYNIGELGKWVDGKGNMNQIQGYIQSKNYLTNNLILYPGLSFTYVDFNKKTLFEPRMAVKWNIINKHTVGLGYGLHGQLQSVSTYLMDLSSYGSNYSNKNLDFTKSHHIVLSYDFNYSDYLRFKMELYYQYLFDVPVTNFDYYSSISDTLRKKTMGTYSTIFRYDDFVLTPLENKGTGKNYGIDLTLEKFLYKNWYYLITASFFESKYTGIDNIERNSLYNRNYVFNIVSGKEFFTSKNNVIGVNVRYVHAGGQRFIPVKEKMGTDNEGNNELLVYLDWDNIFEPKLPDYRRLDISLSFRINKKKVSHSIFLDIQNLFNRKNSGGVDYWDSNKDTYIYWEQYGLIPILKYRMEF